MTAVDKRALQGATPAKDALRLSTFVGVYCVGFCWSLLLPMFSFGVGNVYWMLTLGTVMGIEKNLRSDQLYHTQIANPRDNKLFQQMAEVALPKLEEFGMLLEVSRYRVGCRCLVHGVHESRY